MPNMFNLENEIPKYKTMEIRNDSGSITGVHPLILDDDFSIKATSKFGQLWESSPSNLTSLLASSFGVPSGQFALQGAQIWQSTDPLTISVNASLEMDIDPYDDVVVPALVLTQTCLPTISSGTETIAGSIEGIIEKTFNLKLKTLIPPGPNIQALMQASSNDRKGMIQQIMSKAGGSKGVYNVRIGFATFTGMIVTSVEPTFSKEVAKSKNGRYYPVRAQMSIEITSMEVATTDMINDVMQS